MVEIERIKFEDFDLEEVVNRSTPVIVTGASLGSCHQSWSGDYLSKKLEDRKFSVHEADTPKLDFRTKNFEYKVYSGHEFISSCQNGGDKYLYLRALGANFRKDKPNFKKDFPELVDDCPNLPDIENISNFRNHSTILRISPKDLEIWLHYDTLDNLLYQVYGEKEILLFDPKDFPYLYIEGDKSKISGLLSDYKELENEFPLLKKANKYTGVLKSGEILFIPALWFHATKALSFAVSINNFFFALESKFYAKDLYGNRDPILVEQAEKHLKQAAECLEKLPERYMLFYRAKLGLKF